MSTEHEHIEPGDPRYDGFRIKELWIVSGVDTTDNQEGIVPVQLDDAMRHSLDVGYAFASDERRAHHLRQFAQDLGRRGIPVRFKHFVLTQEENFE